VGNGDGKRSNSGQTERRAGTSVGDATNQSANYCPLLTSSNRSSSGRTLAESSALGCLTLARTSHAPPSESRRTSRLVESNHFLLFLFSVRLPSLLNERERERERESQRCWDRSWRRDYAIPMNRSEAMGYRWQETGRLSVRSSKANAGNRVICYISRTIVGTLRRWLGSAFGHAQIARGEHDCGLIRKTSGRLD